MQTVKILYIGRNCEIRDTVVRLINSHESWTATGVLSDDEAIAAWNNEIFDIVLLGNGITEVCEEYLSAFFKSKKADIIIIQHYGGGSGLLSNEILAALEQHSSS